LLAYYGFITLWIVMISRQNEKGHRHPDKKGKRPPF
jgi:hypothetical protein